MGMEVMSSADLGETMLKRADMFAKMSKSNLELDWIQEFPLDSIVAGCERIALAGLPIGYIQEKSIQKELIQNSAFAGYCVDLMNAATQADGADEQTEQPEASGRQRKTSFYDIIYGLSKLLLYCWERGRDITAYPLDKLLCALRLSNLSDSNKLILLDNFSDLELATERWENAVASLCVCNGLPQKLNDKQRELLLEPFVGTQTLFSRTRFNEIWAVIESCPDLTSIMRLLHEQCIKEELGLEEYKRFRDDVSERYTLLEALCDELGAENMYGLLRFWQEGSCSLNELRHVKKQISGLAKQVLDRIFMSYSSYANMLYKNCFRTIDLSDIPYEKEAILVYAMSHKKRHFIQLVDDNAELFHNIPQYSILFQKGLYEKHFNLNELTLKDLGSCIKMERGKLDIDGLQEERTYTFPEIRALYDTPKAYFILYHMLISDSQDYRLRVLRQLQKRNLLDGVEEKQLMPLAAKLNIKPLYDWIQEEFGHIAALTAEVAVQLLPHYEELEPLLSGMRSEIDALLVLRNLESLNRFDTVDALKANLAEIDEDWKQSIVDMALSEEFQKQYQESIIRFLCHDGAHIARTYQDCLGEDLQKSYHRVVKAELMGKLRELKYFDGDLQKELDLPLTNLVLDGWKQNLEIAKNGMEVKEFDDFFSTMLLGVQPHRTCMSYQNGEYRKCLLSAFDSNKKVLYVTFRGHIVARAFLRLTKGRLTKAEYTGNGKFTFVDLEDVAGSRQENSHREEAVVLFLERPYFGGINAEQETRARNLLIELACKKADELGIMPVLSMSYCDSKAKDFVQTSFNIYISKTKAGAQYLDSLDGQATVDTEGSYKANTFLVRKK